MSYPPEVSAEPWSFSPRHSITKLEIDIFHVQIAELNALSLPTRVRYGYRYTGPRFVGMVEGGHTADLLIIFRNVKYHKTCGVWRVFFWRSEK